MNTFTFHAIAKFAGLARVFATYRHLGLAYCRHRHSEAAHQTLPKNPDWILRPCLGRFLRMTPSLSGSCGGLVRRPCGGLVRRSCGGGNTPHPSLRDSVPKRGRSNLRSGIASAHPWAAGLAMTLPLLLAAVFAFARPESARAADIEAKLGDTVGADKFVVNDSAGSAKFAVLSSGKVGIGITSPGTELEVSTGSTNYQSVRIDVVNGSSSTIYGNFGGTETEKDLILGSYTYRTNQLVLDTTGNVGIGTTTPGAKLDVLGTVAGGESVLARLHNNDLTAGTTSTLAVRMFDRTAKIQGIRTANNEGNDLAFLVDSTAAGDDPTERMSITESGNVGIGTAAPTRDLHVHGGSGGDIAITDSTSGSLTADGMLIQQFGADSYVWNNENGFMVFATNNAEKVRITSLGLVGIGETNPSSTLHVKSTGSLAIPQGAAPTVDAAGEVAIDTTSDQLVYFGGAKRVLPYPQYKSATLASPTDADNFNLFKAPYALTITDIECIVVGGTSVVIDVEERTATGTIPASVDAPITCDTDGASDDGVLTNGPIDAGDWVSLDIGIVTGTVTQVTVTITYTADAT